MADQELNLFDDELEPESSDEAKKPKRSAARKAAADTGEEAAELSFEKALERLEALVEEMEEGQLSLDDCMNRFEQGTKLANRCTTKLAETEKKVELLMKDTPAGGEWRSIEDGEEAGAGSEDEEE